MKLISRRFFAGLVAGVSLAISGLCLAGAESDGRITLASSGRSVGAIASELDALTSATVRGRGLTGSVYVPRFVVRDATLQEALDGRVEALPGLVGYQPADRPGTYELWDLESYREECLPVHPRPKVFVPKHISARELAEGLEEVLTPGVGVVAFDARANKVFVTDLPVVMEKIEAAVVLMDVGGQQGIINDSIHSQSTSLTNH